MVVALWPDTAEILAALLDARALAVPLDASGDVATALARYAALRRWHIALYQGLSRAFAPLYQSGSRLLPVLRDRVLAPVTRWPGLRRLTAASVAGTLLDPRPRLGLPGSALPVMSDR